MSQKVPVNTSEQIEDTSQFIEDFKKKTIMKKVMKDIFSKLMFSILKNYMNFIMIYHCQMRGGRLKRSKNLKLIYVTKMNTLYT